MDGVSLTQSFERFAMLGAEWVMWLLLVMGFIALILFFVRVFFLSKYRVDVDGLIAALKPEFIRDWQQTSSSAQIESLGVGNVQSMEIEVTTQVLNHWQSSEDALDNLVQKTILENRQSYEKSISYFGIVGSNAPFVGLLGTVIGVIISFKELGDNPKGGLEVVGPGISEALVATAVGLLVAIPAVVMFNYLKGKIRRRVQNAELVYRHLLTLKKIHQESEQN